jgi:hypothetical protein
MKISYRLILILLLGVFSALSTNLQNKRGFRKTEVKLTDGEIFQLDTFNFNSGNKELIGKEYYSKLNTALIRSLENDTNDIGDLISFINNNCINDNIGYSNILPYTSTSGYSSKTAFPNGVYYEYNGWYNFNSERSEGILNYFHHLVQNKTARTFLFNQALEILVGLCKTYPKDFAKDVLKELDELLVFSNSIKTINEKSYDSTREKSFWNGFIYRRYLLDQVHISEIQADIQLARQRISALDVSLQSDAMFEFSLNNQVSIFYSMDKFSLYSKINQKEIYFGKDFEITKVKFFKDLTGEYYQIHLVEGYNRIPKRMLFDKYLKIVE